MHEITKPAFGQLTERWTPFSGVCSERCHDVNQLLDDPNEASACTFDQIGGGWGYCLRC